MRSRSRTNEEQGRQPSGSPSGRTLGDNSAVTPGFLWGSKQSLTAAALEEEEPAVPVRPGEGAADGPPDGNRAARRAVRARRTEAEVREIDRHRPDRGTDRRPEHWAEVEAEGLRESLVAGSVGHHRFRHPEGADPADDHRLARPDHRGVLRLDRRGENRPCRVRSAAWVGFPPMTVRRHCSCRGSGVLWWHWPALLCLSCRPCWHPGQR
jgi:hypothetical protein